MADPEIFEKGRALIGLVKNYVSTIMYRVVGPPLPWKLFFKDTDPCRWLLLHSECIFYNIFTPKKRIFSPKGGGMVPSTPMLVRHLTFNMYIYLQSDYAVIYKMQI